jgi:enamine deaminase RidA (YjgF/YER057c/UK114 family)
MTDLQNRLHIPPPSGFGPPLPFSMGVFVGNTLYLAGHIAVDPATKKVPNDIESEVRILMGSVRDTLGKAGLTLQDLVYVQVFCPDVGLFEKFNSIYRAYFQEPLPTRAFIGSGPLLFGARFEIQGIAVKC